jgi:hypothetical protein
MNRVWLGALLGVTGGSVSERSTPAPSHSPSGSCVTSPPLKPPIPAATPRSLCRDGHRLNGRISGTASVANGPRQQSNGPRVCSPARAGRDRRRRGLIGDSCRLSILVFPARTRGIRDTRDQKSGVSSLHDPGTSTSTKADARCSPARLAAAFGSKSRRRQLPELLSSVIANAR